MKKRRWSKEEKLKVIEEAKKEGVQVTLRKHGLYPATYYSWKKKLLVEGEGGLSDQETRKKTRQRLAQLEDEVSLLKQLLAEKEMEIALRDELLKKKYPKARKKP
jgi:putative transposase